MSEIFEDRRHALEEQFFKKQNEALLEKLKAAAALEASREELTRLTGITRGELLDALAGMRLGARATLVLSLYPLVDVAWADGSVTDRERQVVLEQAAASGVQPGSAAALFLAQWLDERPEANWAHLWMEYTKALAARLKPEDLALLKAELMGRARHVAEASGGILGKGWSLNSAEKEALTRLEQAFA